MKKLKPINHLKMWAYFSPNGYIQVRSVADTKKVARAGLSLWGNTIYDYRDYEKDGYYLKRVIVDIQIT